MSNWEREAIEEDLSRIDDWRKNEFQGHRRAALALGEQLGDRLGFMEPADLLDLARDRGCGDPLPTTATLNDALRGDPGKGEALCREVADRIVDTAIFGRDLVTVKLEGLVELAYRHQVEHGRMLGDWRTHDELLPASRSRLRHAQVFLHRLGLDDRNTYPERDSDADHSG